MLPLFDLMTKAQNGTAMEAMSKQFGLAQEQMTQAMTALMPAFSTGLKRSAANPYDFSALMSAAASGNYAKYFEDMGKAFTPEGISDGNDMLGKIFGSKEVSRAVAAQAAQMSGIGQDVYKQMMPVVANAMVGGFFKQMAGQLQAAGEAIASGKASDMITPMMQAAGLAEKPKSAMDQLMDNPFTQSLQAMFQQPAAKDAGPAAMMAANPFLAMFETMMKPAATDAAKASTAETDASQARAEDTIQDGGGNAYAAMVNQMFDSGIEVQKNYQKSMEGIFDSYANAFKPAEK